VTGSQTSGIVTFSLFWLLLPSHCRCRELLLHLVVLSITTIGRTPLDEWSARHIELYLTTHNIHNRQISMPQAGFEPAIPASERPQTHAIGRAAATGTGFFYFVFFSFFFKFLSLAGIFLMSSLFHQKWRHQEHVKTLKKGRKRCTNPGGTDSDDRFLSNFGPT